MTEDLPQPDQLAGAPHPRETEVLYGQDQAQRDFLDAFTAGRLHSGWMITGPRGIGKATLAWKLAAFLLATPSDEGGLFDAQPAPTSLKLPQDHPDLRLISSGAHPRLYVVRRPFDEKTGKLRAEITVDTVRGLKGFFQMSATDGGRRVVIVDAADELNRNAANAILKELEEPPANCTILLVTHQPSRLLPTIRSRCRVLRCAPLSGADLTAALTQAGFATEATESLTALSGGSVGDAIRLLGHDGLSIYASLVQLMETLPHLDRPTLLKLAESCAGRGAEARFELTLDLIDQLLARAARTGLLGEPDTQGAPGEARLLARLSPNAHSARAWARIQQSTQARARHGKAVNLDPAALILDILFAVENTAQSIAA